MSAMRLTCAALLSAVLAAPLAAAEPPPADASTWAKVDIVPMPKRVALGGRDVGLKGAVIVLGARASEQDGIGGDWINDHLERKGAARLRVVREDRIPLAAPVVIHVGTRESSVTIERAARQGRFRLGPRDPGERGYVVHWDRAGKRNEVYLAGADPVGALYACVTFAELLRGKGADVRVRQAGIVDWPDFPTCGECVSLYNPETRQATQRAGWGNAPSPAELKAYVKARKAHLDRLLRWKYSAYNCQEAVIRWRRKDPNHQASRVAMAEVNDYAKARGIRPLAYCFSPFVCKQKDLPNYPKRCATLHNGRRWRGWVRCWSMDKERRKFAGRLGDYIRDCGITDVGFHDTDTGGFYNPAQWALRCDVCRKRWGDDYVAATVNKFRIFYDEIKKRVPDARLHLTLDPYNISVMTPKGAEDYLVGRYGPGPNVAARAKSLRDMVTGFWTRVNAAMPKDVTFCIRETGIGNVRAFTALTKGHGVFIWYKSGSNQWMSFYDETPRFIPTFRSGDRNDMVYTVSMNLVMPVKALAVREYAWNVKAPGVGSFHRLPLMEHQKHAEAKGPVYDVVLPHVVRNVFGREAAPEVTEALRCNVAPHQIFDERHRMKPLLTTSKLMLWQAEEAARGAKAMDRLYKRLAGSEDQLGMDPYARWRVIYLREVMHCCEGMARVRAQDLLARELAKKGKLTEARQALAKGRELIAATRADMKRLLAERPPHPFYNAPPRGNRHNRRWRRYTPAWGMDLDGQAKALAQAEKELPGLAAAGHVSKRALATLKRRRVVHVYPTREAPKIDGVLDEPAWRSALPAQAFWAYPGWASIARAQTEARFMRKGNTLYVGVKCWTPGGAPIKAKVTKRDDKGIFGDDHAELFLWPKSAGSAYYHLVMNPKGALYDIRHYEQKGAGGGAVKRLDLAWNAEGAQVRATAGKSEWTVEASIPLKSFRPDNWRSAWRANVGRYFADPVKDGEWSAFMKPGGKSFHDKAHFLSLVFSKSPAPKPLAEVVVAGLKARTQTLDDRVATMVDFGLKLNSTRVLHNVVLTAETLDEKGKTHFKKEIQRLGHLVFEWRSQEPFTLGYERVVKGGALRVRMASDETSAEVLVPFGVRSAEALGVLAPPSRKGGPGDFRATRALARPCYLPGAVTDAKGKALRLLERRKGTVEFWILPRWGERHALEPRTPWAPVRAFLHSGLMRRDHPELTNVACFALLDIGQYENVHAFIRDKRYAGWTAWAYPEPILSGARPEWRHVACVWDAAAGPKDQVRLYVDGRRVRHSFALDHAERLGKDASVRLPERTFAVQLLSLNTGRRVCPGLMDELRISRVARYQGEFKPSTRPLAPDRDTTALFHFDSDLKGEGMTPEGARYVLEAVPGALEVH